MSNAIRARWTIAIAITMTASAACATLAIADDGFPPVKPGLWRVVATRRSSDGTVRTWTLWRRLCTDASPLFMGYFGPGIIEKQGCRFDAARLSANRYRLTAACVIRGIGASKSEMTVFTGRDRFHAILSVREGARRYSGAEDGLREGDCSG